LEYLTDIFRRGFQPRYCLEDIRLNDSRSIRGMNTGIPMTCFCDISLSQISNHIKTYGNYGIGMKKEWGIENRLNPIIYLNQDSFVAEPLSIIAESGLKLNGFKDMEARLIGNDIINSWTFLLMFSKPYSGDFIHHGKTHKNVKFYNEREWRFIPTEERKAAPYGTLDKEKMKDSKELEIANKKLENYQLHFTPNDVKYIFVKEENEIHTMVDRLRSIKSPIYDNKTIDILTSKILTTEQIFEDF
jgi:hypothetical protein